LSLHLAQSSLSLQILTDTFGSLLSRRVDFSLTSRSSFISGLSPRPASKGVKVERDACPLLGWCGPCLCLLTGASPAGHGGAYTVALGRTGRGGGEGPPRQGPSSSLPRLLVTHLQLLPAGVSSPWDQPFRVGYGKALLAVLPSWGPCDSQKLNTFLTCHGHLPPPWHLLPVLFFLIWAGIA